jgi:hypothetical protein
VYVHVLAEEVAEALTLPGTAGLDVERVSLFGTGEAVQFTQDGDVVIDLPLALRNEVDTIVVIHLSD